MEIQTFEAFTSYWLSKGALYLTKHSLGEILWNEKGYGRNSHKRKKHWWKLAFTITWEKDTLKREGRQLLLLSRWMTSRQINASCTATWLTTATLHAHRTVCRQVHDTVHHIFSSRFWSAPVMRNRQKGTLWKQEDKWEGISINWRRPVIYLFGNSRWQMPWRP